MQTTDLYQHDHFKHLAQITALEGQWVEFMEQGQLRWLERMVFEQAYTYYRDGDPIGHDLAELRAQARKQGILVPREILAITVA